MRIVDIADKAGTAGKWSSTDHCGRRTIRHYTTDMLWFHLNSDGKWDGNVDTVDFSLGHGSVSDQHGMNQLFKHLGMPFYFVRSGRRADIIEK